MVRVITQETFDEVVKENMETFEWSAEEAIRETTAEFEAQGIDLSNIIKDLIISGEETVTSAIEKLKDLAENCSHDEAILVQLEALAKGCSKGLAHRIRASKDGAYPVLIDLLEKKFNSFLEQENGRDALLTVEVLNTLATFMDTQPDLLDDRGLDIIFRILNTVTNEDILAANIRWASMCCVKHEKNRQRIFARGIGDSMRRVLQSRQRKLISEALLLLRRMTLDDDIRVEFGKAHEHARDICIAVIDTLTTLLKEYTKPPLVSEIMLTIASLLVRHELCKMAAEGAGDILFAILADNFDNTAVVQQAHRLITALAGNDDVKRDLVKSGIIPLIISLLSKHMSNAQTVGIILKSIGALTLREPEHGRQFLESGAADVVVECIKVHPKDATVQKMACIAIRNLVSRCRDYNGKFHELGLEALLQEANEEFGSEFGYEIKAALRDVGCDVKLEEQWTGSGKTLQND